MLKISGKILRPIVIFCCVPVNLGQLLLKAISERQNGYMLKRKDSLAHCLS